MNTYNKKIFAKIAVFVTVSGSVFVFSAASATASPAPSQSPASSHGDIDRTEGNAHLLVAGPPTHWTATMSCFGDKSGKFLGYLDATLPGERILRSLETYNPQLIESGTGGGKASMSCHKRTSSEGYEPAGTPSGDIY